MEHGSTAFGIQPVRRFIAHGFYFFRRGGVEQPLPERGLVFEDAIRPYIPARAHPIEGAQPGTIPELQILLIDGLRSTESHRRLIN
jgi:hypothetical protein